jgi:activating signal cointegrator 1
MRFKIHWRRTLSEGACSGHNGSMKCLSVRQPWAMLILRGVKQFETRTWRTDYRGPLAIHASRQQDDAVKELCRQPLLRGLLAAAGYTGLADLPRGCVLGVVDLIDCLLVPPEGLAEALVELALGDYRPGRFAWQLANPRPLAEPLRMPGQLSLFEIPDLL